MATPGGTEHPDVAVDAPAEYPLSEIERDLRERPGAFEFFQAVRLLIRLSAGREPVGGFSAPDREALRFTVNHSLSFPPSQVHAIDWSGEIPRMSVNFMGLTGPLGTLPYAYSELINDRLRNRDSGLAAFFDIFNHRMISLFYQAWEKYRFAVAYERDGIDRVSRLLRSLIGIGTQGLQDRLPSRIRRCFLYRPAWVTAALRGRPSQYFGRLFRCAGGSRTVRRLVAVARPLGAMCLRGRLELLGAIGRRRGSR